MRSAELLIMWLIAGFSRRASGPFHPNIHIGPHKTGTSSIQWFLKENRAELLKYGYFVPESETIHGAHHAIVRKLCGQELRDHQQSAAAKFARALNDTPSEVIVISSEALEGLLTNRDYAK